MLEVKELHFRYGRGLPEVLRGINLSLEQGQIGILLGRNGAGKSTLFRCILGIDKPSAGTVLLDGQELSRLPLRQRARHVAYVPQNISFGDLTVFDTVLTGRLAYFGLQAGEEDHKAVHRILEELGLTAFAQRSAERLSGGEKQKVAIARALVGEPELIIFDEPTGNLDLANERLLMGEMKKLATQRGISVLCSLHDLNQALTLGDRFFLMKEGQIRHSGGREVFRPDIIEEIFGVKMEVLHVDNKTILVGGDL